MIKAAWITTVDNPYDYFEQFDEWYQYDVSHGYDTCGLIMREAKVSSEVPPCYNASTIEEVCDEIIKFDFDKIYKKVEAYVDDDFYDV